MNVFQWESTARLLSDFMRALRFAPKASKFATRHLRYVTGTSPKKGSATPLVLLHNFISITSTYDKTNFILVSSKQGVTSSQMHQTCA